MKAAILRDFKTPLSIEEIAKPTPAANEVLIEVQACGVCHSDLHVADGDWPQIVPITKKPLILGHEIAGNIVEIGAGVTIDRGALGATVIGKGTKIDNLVHIAHNVEIGEHCLIIAQVGIAGSAKMGNYVTLGGQVGVAGHLTIGNHVTVAAQSGVMTDTPDGGSMYWGTPMQPIGEIKRQLIATRRLPELLKRVAELEKKLGMKRKRDGKK